MWSVPDLWSVPVPTLTRDSDPDSAVPTLRPDALPRTQRDKLNVALLMHVLVSCADKLARPVSSPILQ